MPANISGLIETIVSLFVEAGGHSAAHGGKGILMTAARKIGWAKGGSGKGGRIKSHRLSGHSMGMGFGARRDLGHYNPKTDHINRQNAQYASAMSSGSGRARPRYKKTTPDRLFGRVAFDRPDSPTGRSGSRWIRHGQSRAGHYTPRPRSFIRF